VHVDDGVVHLPASAMAGLAAQEGDRVLVAAA
jgi:hypothetical protein